MGAACAVLFVALAGLPTPLAAEPPAPAALIVSEVMPAAQGNLSEAEGEWVELSVAAGGQLEGLAITDLDGAVDFVFPALAVEPGERIVVANGLTAPPGLDPSARLFKAGKSWWTFDNAGDDVSVLSPDGAVMDRLAYGDGPALDPPPAGFAEAAAFSGAIPAGASLGRIGNATLATVPTPGLPNVPLSGALGHEVELAAILLEGDTATPVLCPAAAGAGSAYLWSVDLGGSQVWFGGAPLANRVCRAPASEGGIAERQALSDAVGLSVAVDPDARPAPLKQGATVALLDPWGAVAFERPLPSGLAAPVRPAVVLVPCDCPEGWEALPVSPAPPEGPARRAPGLTVVKAGGALQSALSDLIENATASLDVNAYLLNSEGLEAALRSAALRGVRVRVLLEGAPVGGQKGHSPLDVGSLGAFNESGTWVRTFRVGASSAARDHAKYFIADGRAVAVLTENLVGAALSDEDPNIGYGAFCACAALAADLEAVFDWDFDRGEARSQSPAWTWPGPRGPVTGAEAEGDTTAALLLSPTPSESAWTGLVESARSSVRVEALSADPETLGPSSPLGVALLAAASRGVAVRVLLSGDFEGLEGSETLRAARALVAAAGPSTRLEVRAFTRGPGSNATLHAKVLVVDERRFILGSHNLVHAAFASNREVSLLVESGEAAKTLGAWIDGHFARASAVVAVGVALRPDAGLGVQAEVRDPPATPPPAFLGFLAAGAAALGWGLVKNPRALLPAWTSKGLSRRASRRAPAGSASEARPRGPLHGLEPEVDSPEPPGAPPALGPTPPPEHAMAPPSVRLVPPTAFDLLGRP